MYLWFLEPATIVSQMHTKTVSLLLAQRLVRLIDEAREARASEIKAAGGLVVFHDWSRVESVDPSASRFLQAAWKKLKPEDIRAVYVDWRVNPLLKIVVQGLNAVAHAMTGKSQTLVDDLRKPLAAHAVRRPSPQATFPDRLRA